jgi:hypothetical protein
MPTESRFGGRTISCSAAQLAQCRSAFIGKLVLPLQGKVYVLACPATARVHGDQHCRDLAAGRPGFGRGGQCVIDPHRRGSGDEGGTAGTFASGGKGAGGNGTTGRGRILSRGASSRFACSPQALTHATSKTSASSQIQSPCRPLTSTGSSPSNRRCSTYPSGTAPMPNGFSTPSTSRRRHGRRPRAGASSAELIPAMSGMTRLAAEPATRTTARHMTDLRIAA